MVKPSAVENSDPLASKVEPATPRHLRSAARDAARVWLDSRSTAGATAAPPETSSEWRAAATFLAHHDLRGSEAAAAEQLLCARGCPSHVRAEERMRVRPGFGFGVRFDNTRAPRIIRTVDARQ